MHCASYLSHRGIFITGIGKATPEEKAEREIRERKRQFIREKGPFNVLNDISYSAVLWNQFCL